MQACVGRAVGPAREVFFAIPYFRRPRVRGDPLAYVGESLDPRLRGDDGLTCFSAGLTETRRSSGYVYPLPRRIDRDGNDPHAPDDDRA